jgi:predicted metal-binding membrane protein
MSPHLTGRTAVQETLPSREKWLIMGVLVCLSIAAWALTIYQSRLHARMGGMEMSMAAPHQTSPMASSGSAHGGMTMPGMPMDATATAEASTALALGLGLFLAMWVAMMVAMMFPSAYPMVLLFARVSKGQADQTDRRRVPTWIFVAGYLAIWTLIGGVMYLASLLVHWVGGQVSWLGEWTVVGSAIILIGAGLYQFSSWKGVCLTHCRSPLSFILHQWRQGRLGAFRMGIDHGAYCVGCCWGLMLVMFVMGLMSLAWMGLLTVVIFLEKVTSYGPALSKVAGGILIVLGVGILLHPSLMQHFSG